jgi:hypothetical protein
MKLKVLAMIFNSALQSPGDVVIEEEEVLFFVKIIKRKPRLYHGYFFFTFCLFLFEI